MRFHPRGLLVLAAFLALVALGIDLRWGIAAILAMTALDALSLLAPFFPPAGTIARTDSFRPAD